VCDSTAFSLKDLLTHINFIYWVQQRREILLPFVSEDTQSVFKMWRFYDKCVGIIQLIKFNRLTEIMILKIQHNLVLIFLLAS